MPGARPEAGVSAELGGGLVVEPKYWFKRNIVSLERAREWQKMWENWRDSAVDDDEEVDGELDAHQRFLLNIADLKVNDWERVVGQVGRPFTSRCV